MVKNWTSEHPNLKKGGTAFKMEIVRGNIRSLMERYLQEAIAIKVATDKGESLLNSNGLNGQNRCLEHQGGWSSNGP